MKKIVPVILVLLISCNKPNDQDAIQYFSLQEVEITEGPFRHAQDLNLKTILEYDVDRLLAPYLREAGLEPKGESFQNWLGLDGHVGGHYLSAMAIHYASTGNEACKRRMEYMISELQRCSENHAKIHPDWGIGYVGGVPDSEGVWSRVKNGEPHAVWDYWVPWYNVHKIYAGLRDAWHYAGNEKAKDLFLALCDWGINLTEGLSDEQMESMLANEYGGMNESYADAYEITGDVRYLNMAKRFSHRALLEPLSQGRDNLDNLHANTQVPKAVGFQRIAEHTGEAQYVNAGQFFWETVTGNRSLAFGGNSRREFFPSQQRTIDFIDQIEGPESCNTHNMLKLTKNLFKIDPQARYADYYEKAVFNHILSTQHPDHGGYVYFTPARPRHYRVYSAPNQAMWCCVGTGLENHGKYGEFIYAYQGDQLYVNLFVSSELDAPDQGFKLSQKTNFPEEEQSQITMLSSGAFDLMIRYPGWVAPGALKITVNHELIKYEETPGSYIKISRNWKSGDQVTIDMPMTTKLETLMNLTDYVAFVHGPILLGAKTETQDLPGLVAGSGRWEHIAHGDQLPLNEAPVIVADESEQIPEKLRKLKDGLTFSTEAINIVNTDNSLTLEPFYKIHDSRYMMYWMKVSPKKYEYMIDSMSRIEEEKLALENRTLDKVQPGEQQPEVDHAMKSDKSNKGVFLDSHWRDARNGGYFSYTLATKSEQNLQLRVKYWGNEAGNRKFDILIDGIVLTTEDIASRWNENQFKVVTYDIPNNYLENKETIEVKFQSSESSHAGGLFDLRLIKNLGNKR